MPTHDDAARHDWFEGGGEMGARTRAFDWSATPLGAPATWSPALRTMVRFLLANRFPQLMWWGPHYIQFYNDAYRPIPGAKHPKALGQPARECWAEIWDVIRPLIDTPYSGGPATWDEDICLELDRHRFREETHFTIAYSPVPDDTVPSGIGGVLATVHEITEKVIGERRIVALRDLGTHLGQPKDADEACEIVARILAAHDRDVPFAAFYLIDRDRGVARRAGATAGLHPSLAPDRIDLEAPVAACPWPFAEALASDGLVLVDELGRRFPGVVPPGPWSDPPTQAVLVPIPSTTPRHPAGLMVAGASARLRVDDHYRDFFELLRTQVATAIANALAYESARRQAEALAAIDRAKTAFFSNVSHEFRTPLTLLIGPLEDGLADDADPLPAAHRERQIVAHRNALRLLRLVNTLLDFSRIEAGRVDATFEPTDLAAFTSDLASNFRSACERAGLTLLVDCPPLPEPVYVDRDMWEKVVLNFLSNALKFTFEGVIEVRLRAVDGRAELAVRDTGTGIDSADLPRVFERFYRIKGARGRTHEGTGIGLALAQELVQLHGGRVGADSAIGRGSTFTAAVPFGTAHLPAEKVGAARTLTSTAIGARPFVEEALQWLPSAGHAAARDDGAPHLDSVSSAPPYGGPAAPAHVLVADDNADMRRYVTQLLARRHRVTAVSDGEAAWEAVQRERPALVVSDVMMPGLDGIGLLARLRGDRATADIPVVLLSARAGEESRVDGLARGADDYVVKPFSGRELIARVDAHLQMASIRREADARKDEFLAMLAHELRNPLAPIRTGLELIRLGGDAPEQVARVRPMLERQVNHMVRLIDDLLDVSRIASGKIRLQREPTALADIVQRALDANRGAMTSKQLDVQVDLPDSPCVLDGDPTRLVQVLSNLLHNAVKFTRKDGWVRVAAALVLRDGGRVVAVSVRDSGIGIPRELLPRVFDLFTQGSAASAEPGLGIGLALAHRLVELHGGRIEARSEGSDRGSEFVVELPLAEGVVTAPAVDAPIGLRAVRRVLVVDDNRDAGDTLAMLLQTLGADTRVAYGGAGALQALDDYDADTVLLDVGMPGLDGYETCRQIRQRLGGRAVIVALTGYGRERDKDDAARAGFDAHLTKPVDARALSAVLSRTTDPAR